jgi:hypothetical protein
MMLIFCSFDDAPKISGWSTDTEGRLTKTKYMYVYILYQKNFDAFIHDCYV